MDRVKRILLIACVLTAVVVPVQSAMAAACSPYSLKKTVQGTVEAKVGANYMTTYYKITREQTGDRYCNVKEVIKTDTSDISGSRVQWQSTTDAQALWSFDSNWAVYFASYAVYKYDFETYTTYYGVGYNVAIVRCSDEGNPTPGQLRYSWQSQPLPIQLYGNAVPMTVRAALVWAQTVNKTVSIPPL